MSDRLYKTGEAAEICMCSQQTIIRCVDSGKIKGYRLPGSTHRRIPSEKLYKFMVDRKMPLDKFPKEDIPLDIQLILDFDI